MIPPPLRLGRDTRARASARDALERVIWDAEGRRRLPSEGRLVAALEGCDPRDVEWTCETSSHGPAYFLPTREWVRLLVARLRGVGVHRVLEVAAGDGHLTRFLREAAPELEIVATDDASWAQPRGRMNARDRREMKGVPIAGLRPGEDVVRCDAVRAVRRFRPDLVLVAWAPPGDLVARLIRTRKPVLEIGTEGAHCGSGPAVLRHAVDMLDGPIVRRALCRLDARPRERRATAITLYDARAQGGPAVER